jgi:VCBS repeat-containing protein
MTKTISNTILMTTIAVILTIGATSQAFALDVSFTPISTTFNHPIGIDHFEGTPDKVVISVNYGSGSPYNFETVAADGSHSQFSTLSGFTDEVKIATARDDGVNSFTPGTMFTGNGIDGQIAKINPDGTFVNPWVDLPGAGNGLMRGSLYVDRTGGFGGDLIVVTTAGEVWRINSAGTPTKLADVDVHLEGVITVPRDPQFGDLAGKIIAGAEDQSRVYAISNTGSVQFWTIPFKIEDIDLIPENENFFGVNFGTGKLLGVPASSFDGVEGEILITQEFGGGPTGLGLLRWDAATNAPTVEFIGRQLGSFVQGQWEHVTFSSAGIVEIPPVEICGDGIDNDRDGEKDEGCNTAPVARDDTFTIPEDGSLSASATATDGEGDSLSYVIVGPTPAGIAFNSDGTFSYTPASNFSGTISFQFQANDGEFDSNVATITIIVTPVNDAPVANDGTNTTPEDTPVNGLVTGSDIDGDSITFALVTAPTNGLVVVNPDGTYTYTPNANFNGEDSFTFVANDGTVNSNIATVTINVTPVNDAPVCSAPTAASYIWPPNHKMVSIGATMNTSDVDGDTVTVAISSIFQDEPTNGLGDGDTSPDANLALGQVRAERSGKGDGRVYVITMTASDGKGGSCSGTVQVIVPHSMKKPVTAVNSGATYNSIIP